MGERIEIEIGDSSFEAEMNETDTATALFGELPVEADPSFWGDEIYFKVPLNRGENEDPTVDLEAGDLAYWPEGSAFCIFFGSTPSSTGSEPRPASPVTVVGKLRGDPSKLRDLDRGAIGRVRVGKAKE